jgi:hypothetical protein
MGGASHLGGGLLSLVFLRGFSGALLPSFEVFSIEIPKYCLHLYMDEGKEWSLPFIAWSLCHVYASD